jgi:hypothetical protein
MNILHSFFVPYAIYYFSLFVSSISSYIYTLRVLSLASPIRAVWINSHWQQNDIFNVSGGASNVVEERVSNIVKRFGLAPNTMGLHWYEWDTLGYTPGSNYTTCSSEITCGFDTHYPENFPARVGFNATLTNIQKLGVRVTPYVNGRIFDQDTESWTKQLSPAKSAAAKKCKNFVNMKELELYNESYGSKAVFAVMCPHTKYWQNTMSDVVGTLTNDYHTDGVYVDQVAAAGPRPCFDPTHNHTLGGGNHWTSGYMEMLRKMRSQVGKEKLLLTESNAEPFMGGLDMYLTLVGFASGDLSPPLSSLSTDLSTKEQDASSYIVPAFQSVYGGYALFMGAEYFQNDFLPNPNVFSAKIANQFLFGAQIGWFSLGGRANQVPNMGLYELLMDSKYDQEIYYLNLLSSVKQKCQKWLTHGRAMRALSVVVNGSHTENALRHLPLHPRHKSASRAESDAHSHDSHEYGLSYSPVMSAAWMSADATSLLLLVTTVERATPASVQGYLNVNDYGFQGENVENEKFDVWSVPSVGTAPPTLLGTYDGSKVMFSGALGVHSVRLFRIEKSTPSNDSQMVTPVKSSNPNCVSRGKCITTYPKYPDQHTMCLATQDQKWRCAALAGIWGDGDRSFGPGNTLDFTMIGGSGKDLNETFTAHMPTPSKYGTCDSSSGAAVWEVTREFSYLEPMPAGMNGTCSTKLYAAGRILLGSFEHKCNVLTQITIAADGETGKPTCVGCRCCTKCMGCACLDP